MAWNLARGQLGSSAAGIYTVPSATKAQVKQIVLHNTGAATNQVSIHLVPNGGSASNANRIHRFNLASNATIYLAASFPDTSATTGDTIQGSATNANEVTYFISGVESAI